MVEKEEIVLKPFNAEKEMEERIYE